MTPNHPTPLTTLAGLPSRLAAFLHGRGIVTCEQAYALVVQLSTVGSQRDLPPGLLMQDLACLQQQLEAVLPEQQRASLTEAGTVRWTSERPLGVLPPEVIERSLQAEPTAGQEGEDEAVHEPPETSDQRADERGQS